MQALSPTLNLYLFSWKSALKSIFLFFFKFNNKTQKNSYATMQKKTAVPAILIVTQLGVCFFFVIYAFIAFFLNFKKIDLFKQKDSKTPLNYSIIKLVQVYVPSKFFEGKAAFIEKLNGFSVLLSFFIFYFVLLTVLV